MPHAPLSRNPSVDRALDDVRRRHRQVQRARRASTRALREAKRYRAVIEAEMLIWDYATDIASHVTSKPLLLPWIDAVASSSQEWPTDKRLHKDLEQALWSNGPKPSVQDLRDQLAVAAATFNETLENTRSRRGPGQPRMSRQVKKETRRAAERDLFAAVSGLSLAITAVSNPSAPFVEIVAAGALGN